MRADGIQLGVSTAAAAVPAQHQHSLSRPYLHLIITHVSPIGGRSKASNTDSGVRGTDRHSISGHPPFTVYLFSTHPSSDLRFRIDHRMGSRET